MRVTASTLMEIAGAVANLERSGLDAPELRVAGLRVTLERQDDQRDGPTLWITDIAPQQPGAESAR